MSAGVVGALLAGGGSRRMGSPKAAVVLAGLTLAERTAATLRQVVDECAPDDGECIQAGGEAIAGLEWPLWPDLRANGGPAAGIEAALTGAAPAPIVVLALDLPLVPAGLLIDALDRVRAGAAIAAPRWADRWHPLCAAYSTAALEPLRRRLDAGQGGLQGLLDELAVAIEEDALRAHGDPVRTLLNVNSPADLETAAALLAGS
ncbi:MAG TPA: molybdenum cofactor guanylyltransferase [Acidobacteriota bacterium]